MKEKLNNAWSKAKETGVKFVKSGEARRIAYYVFGFVLGYFSARADFIWALKKTAKEIEKMAD